MGVPAAVVRRNSSPIARGPTTTDVGLVLFADSRFEDVPAPDIVVVHGGPGTMPALGDTAAVDWLRQAHTSSKWTTSVCTGSLLHGAAGVLQGKRATSHWILRDMLRDFGAEAVAERLSWTAR
jgi:putative intracellular protease/amidase